MNRFGIFIEYGCWQGYLEKSGANAGLVAITFFSRITNDDARLDSFVRPDIGMYIYILFLLPTIRKAESSYSWPPFG